MLEFNGDFRYVPIYMWPYVKLYACARWYIIWEGLSVNHFLKHSNHFKLTLKMILNGTERFGYCLTFKLLTTALLPRQK